MEQIILNLVPGGVSPVCYVSQYDVGRKIRLHLRNGSDPYVLSGAETVTATIRKVSGEELIYDIANTSASYVDLIVNYDATDVIGESVCELIITESGLRIGSANFKMRVDPDVYSGDQKLEVVSATSENPNLSFETNVEENLLELKAGFSPVQEGTPWIDSNEVNKVPYIKRAVAGTATRIGNHLYDKLVGGTVAFNQLVKNGNFADSSNWNAIRSTLSVSNNVGTITKSDNNPYIEQRNNFIAGHKYLYNADLKANNSTVVLSAIYDNESVDRYSVVTDETWTNAAFIITPATTGTNNKERYRITLRTGDTAQVKNAYLIDLTAMFGSTIADYIYSLEQATAGAGVAWFKALFPNDYYAYNAGELMSVKATTHVMKNASNTVIGNYPLDSDLELRGIPKLVNNKLEYDGDEYTSDGNVLRKYGIVDLGSLDWSSITHQTFGTYFYSNISNLIKYKGSYQLTVYPVLCYKYVTVKRDASLADGDKVLCIDGAVGAVSQIQIKDSAYTDATALKASLSGVYLVYEKETATTETAQPFTNPQVCDENGTEEYTDSRAVAIPVGHETYQANTCPINGYTEANITRCGVNLMHVNSRVSQTTAGVTYTSDDNYIYLNGTKSGGGYADMSNLTMTLPRGTYYLKAFVISGTASNTVSLYAFDGTNNISPDILGGEKSMTLNKTTTFRFRMAIWADGTVCTNYKVGIVISTASISEYSEYTGNTYTVSFGKTVYGCVLDVTRGKLAVNKLRLDMGDVEWYYPASDEYFYADIADILPNPTWGATSDILSDTFETTNPNAIANKQGDNTIAIWPTGHRIVVRDTAYTDRITFRTAMNGKYVVYPLSTPFDIDLTPVQISAIVGVNNLMHDANGGTEVKFFRMISAS